MLDSRVFLNNNNNNNSNYNNNYVYLLERSYWKIHSTALYNKTFYAERYKENTINLKKMSSEEMKCVLICDGYSLYRHRTKFHFNCALN